MAVKLASESAGCQWPGVL